MKLIDIINDKNYVIACPKKWMVKRLDLCKEVPKFRNGTTYEEHWDMYKEDTIVDFYDIDDFKPELKVGDKVKILCEFEGKSGLAFDDEMFNDINKIGVIAEITYGGSILVDVNGSKNWYWIPQVLEKVKEEIQSVEATQDYQKYVSKLFMHNGSVYTCEFIVEFDTTVIVKRDGYRDLVPFEQCVFQTNIWK